MKWQDLADVATTLSIAVTVLLSYIESRRGNSLRSSELMIAAKNKYDEICALRASNPLTRREAADWVPSKSTDSSPERTFYEGYVEMSLGFIETYVYLTYVEKSFPHHLFSGFIEPMIWLEVSYKRRAFEVYSRSSSISPQTSAYLVDLVRRIDLQEATHPFDNLRTDAELAKFSHLFDVTEDNWPRRWINSLRKA